MIGIISLLVLGALMMPVSWLVEKILDAMGDDVSYFIINKIVWPGCICGALSPLFRTFLPIPVIICLTYFAGVCIAISIGYYFRKSIFN